MTETQQQQAAQSVNGTGPMPAPGPLAEGDTGEKWLGILVLAAGVFLLFVGIDRVSGGKLTGALQGGGGGDDAEG